MGESSGSGEGVEEKEWKYILEADAVREGSGSGDGPEIDENAVFRHRRSSQYINNENFPIAERVMEGMVESSGSGEGVEEKEWKYILKADAVREGSGSGDGPEIDENAVFRHRRSSQYINNENFPIAERVMEGMVESSGSGEGVEEKEWKNILKADAVREG